MRTIIKVVFLLVIFLIQGCNTEEVIFQLPSTNQSNLSEILLNTSSGNEIEKGIIRVK